MALEVRDKQALKQVGANVRAERNRLGMSQEELGRQTDLGQQVISEIENATTATNVTRFIRIAVALDLPISRLFVEIDDLDAS